MLHRQDAPTENVSMCIQLYTLFQYLKNIYAELYYLKLHTDIFNIVISKLIINISFRFIWLNVTYIIPTFYRNKL